MTLITRLIRLEEVATFMGGSTPSRTRPRYFGGGIPWVKTTDLNNGLIYDTDETLTTLGLAESSCKMVPAKAVLVAMYGGFNQIGRTGLLQQDSAINQALTAILPDPRKLDPAFLLEWLNFRVDYWKRFAGSSRKDPNQFERRVASADLSNYKVVRRGQYAYNPSRINVGSITRLDGWDEGVLSPMYVVFSLDKAKVDSDYFLHWLDSHEASERIKKSAQGSVRETVSFSEFARLAISLPDINKQAAIARYLDALREEIATLGNYAEKLKTQKRGLTQKLLTGQWRVRLPSDEVLV